jgi:hypothetical protein
MRDCSQTLEGRVLFFDLEGKAGTLPFAAALTNVEAERTEAFSAVLPLVRVMSSRRTLQGDGTMNRMLATSAALALMLGVSSAAFAASAEDCNALFQKADLNKDGSLQADEAKLFLDAMSQAQVQPKDASLVTQEEFRLACEKDAFASIDPATIGTGQAPAATAEQPAATTDQTQTTAEEPAATTEQPAATAEQPATTEQPAATAEQPAATTDQTASTDPAAAAPAEQALAIPEGIMASDLIGANIYSTTNENIAEIKDVIFSQEGQATHVIVDAGDNNVAVEMSQLKVAATDDGLKVMMNASQADLANLPAINTK